MEGQAFIIDQTPSDAMAFDKWIASYPPTNASTGLKLSSTFTAIWFNTNYNDWVYSIGSNQLSSTQTAVIGEYKSSDGPQLIGVSFTGGLVPTKAVPNIDFGERYAFSDR